MEIPGLSTGKKDDVLNKVYSSIGDIVKDIPGLSMVKKHDLLDENHSAIMDIVKKIPGHGMVEKMYSLGLVEILFLGRKFRELYMEVRAGMIKPLNIFGGREQP